MPNELTNFQQELNNPATDGNSELYRAVSPLLNLQNIPEAKNKFDAERINKLKDDVRRGMVGLEYLTGLKSNKAETFYDKHPAQATISDLLASSGALGTATALGVPAANGINQARQLKKLISAYDSRRSDPAQSMLNKLSPMEGKHPGRVTDPHVLQMFGSLNPEDVISAGAGEHDPITKRLKFMDMVSGGKSGYEAQYNALTSPEEKKNFLKNLVGTKEHNILGEYAEIHKGLRDGGKNLKAPIFSGVGDKLRERVLTSELANKNKHVYNFLNELLPSKHQPIRDFVNSVIGNLPEEHKSPALINAIFEDALNKQQGEAGLLGEDLVRNQFGRSRAAKLIRRLGPGAVVGGGIAAGGLGLHAALKGLQNQVYGKEKIKEWKRNLLRSKGQFEEANRIK